MIEVVDTGQTPRVSVTGCPTFSEGDAGVGDGGNHFEVVLSRAVSQEVTLTYTVRERVGGGATAGEDFVPATGTVTLRPGVVVERVSVGIVGDLVVETDESFDFVISNAVNATIGRADCYGIMPDYDGTG